MIPDWLLGTKIGCFDLETDFIPTTMIFCNSIVILEISTEGTITISPPRGYTYKWTTYAQGSLLESVEVLNSCDFISAYNLNGFDLHEIPKHLGVGLTARQLDTMILSKLVYSKDELMSMDPALGLPSSLWGRYSLKAFALRLGGDEKIEYEDFTHLNKEMFEYCNRDTEVAAELLKHLLLNCDFPLEQVIEVEHRAANIVYEQGVMGFYLDITKARALNTSLLTEKLELATELATIFSPKFLKDGKVKSYKKLSTVKKYLHNTSYIPLLGTPND